VSSPGPGEGGDGDPAAGDGDGSLAAPERAGGGAVTSPGHGEDGGGDPVAGGGDGGDAAAEAAGGGAVASPGPGEDTDGDPAAGDGDGGDAAPEAAGGEAVATAEDLLEATADPSFSVDRPADRLGSGEAAGAPPDSPSGGAGATGQEHPDASSSVVFGAPPGAEQVDEREAGGPGPSWAGILRVARGLGDRPRLVILAAAVPVLAVVLIASGWAIDSAMLSGQVMRNVEVAGRPVGGQSEASLPDVIDRIAEDVPSRQVRIVEGDRTYETTAGDIGLTLDRDATAAAALDVGRRDAVLARPFSWLGSFFDPRQVPVRYTVSEGAVALKLAELQGDDALAPAEPTIVYDENTQQLAARPGRIGVGIDAQQVATALADAAERAASGPIEITAQRTEVAPRFTDEEAVELAVEANEMTAGGLTLAVEQTSVRVEAHQLREWIGRAPPSDGFDLAIDGTAVAQDLPTLVGALPGAPRNATVTLGSGGNPDVRPASRGLTCCADDSAERIWDALQAGEPTVRLTAQEADPEITTDEARQWRIARPVGGSRAWQDGAEVPGPAPGFTTYHQPGESRVVNIHRIADLVRGAVIPPGGTFSVNERVGERTTDNGFVEAGAISNGQHVSEVGGGVSQFATTTFNAAYFAGLDIVESQAHSEYFDRYPRGREATMGYPNPDLVIENNTPYGVLIWTSYTDTSLTVTMYSTPYAGAEQTAIGESRSGQCTNVETTRTRTYPDGRRETDTFRATYRPGAGIDCNGNPLPPAAGD
jgi:hypothetical protein